MRKTALLLILIMMTLMMGACGRKTAEESETAVPAYTFAEDGNFQTVSFGHLTLKITTGYLSTEAMDQAAQEVEAADHAVESFLADLITDDSAFTCELKSGSGTTHTDGSRITVYYAENQTICYAQLIAQAVMDDSVPDWLWEGLGAYIGDRSGESMMDKNAHMIEAIQNLPLEDEEKNPITYDINDLAVVLKEQSLYADAASFGDLTEAVLGIGYAEEAYNYKGAYDVFAGSFVSYLVDQYGVSKVLELCSGKEFATTFGANLEQVRSQWWEQL